MLTQATRLIIASAKVVVCLTDSTPTLSLCGATVRIKFDNDRNARILFNALDQIISVRTEEASDDEEHQ